MSIRVIGDDDWPALARIHAASFAEAWDEAALRRLAARPGAIALAAGSGPNAFVLAQCAADECEILTLASAPAARRSGCARALVQATAAQAAAQGAVALYLEVGADNPAAIALYRGLGFAEAGSRKGYYRRPSGTADALLLKATLPLAAAIPLQGSGPI